MKCWSCSWILSCNKNTTEGRVSQENYEFRPLRNVCTKTLTCDLRLPVVLQTILRVQWSIHQINNCLFKQLVIRSTFQCVHAPQSLVFDLFLEYKKIQFFFQAAVVGYAQNCLGSVLDRAVRMLSRGLVWWYWIWAGSRDSNDAQSSTSLTITSLFAILGSIFLCLAAKIPRPA